MPTAVPMATIIVSRLCLLLSLALKHKISTLGLMLMSKLYQISSPKTICFAGLLHAVLLKLHLAFN